MDSNSSDAQNESRPMAASLRDRHHRILLADINVQDTTFRITTREDLEDLLVTLEPMGLLHPPVLLENSSGYKIICGFRRIAAGRHLGWKDIAANVFKASADRFKLAQLAIADNALQRPLNLVETSRALKLLAAMGANQQQIRQASLRLGLPTNPTVAGKVQKICGLPLPIQEGILTGTINLSMALELGKLEPESAADLVGLFNQLKVGLNRQRELLLLLSEIAQREDISIQQLVAEKPLQKILQNTEMDRAIQRQNIRSHLRQRRYPAISRAEADYQKWVKRLKLGNHIKLVPPKDFEGPKYALTLHFENRQDLSAMTKRIAKILENPAFAKILDR